MATHNLRLLFMGQKRGRPMAPAVSHVEIKGFSQHKYGIGRGGRKVLTMPLITSRAYSFQELKSFINRLRRELDEIEKQAKSKYLSHERRRLGKSN